jgi:hypothetical protein
MASLSNRRHECFAREVAALTPYARAYREAGFKGDPRWHRYNASKLANKPHIKVRIAELRAEFEARAGLHWEYITRQLLPVVEANPADLFEKAGDGHGERLKAISKMSRELTAAISKIKCDPETGCVTEIALHNKVEAGNLLLRTIGAIVEKHEIDAPNLTDRLARRLDELSHEDQLVLVSTLETAVDRSTAEGNSDPDTQGNGRPECMRPL